MNTNIDSALNVLYQRQISSRKQLLKEMLRVKMTLKKIEEDSTILNDKQKIFQLMKKTTEDELGFFPADRADFLAIFDSLKDIDLIDFTLEIYKNDRMGTVISPVYLSEYISGRIKKLKPEKVLITEAEKHLSGLREMVSLIPKVDITFTTQYKPMYILLQLAFAEDKNIRIRFESIYTECLINEKFDYIYSLPAFGHKPDELSKEFLTRDSDGIAIENMLDHISDKGTLDIIVPAKITFSGMGYEKLRSHITENYHVENIYILPEGTFRPATAVKTYLFSIATEPQEKIEIGTFELDKKGIKIEDKKSISTKEFLAHEDWRIELLLAEDDENIQKFKISNLPKVKLKDIAEVFRGKSILKKDTSLGNISVLNISNIENGEIDYRDMDTIDEEDRKVKRYELTTGDVVLSCRGTAIKSAVFEAQDKIIIASANLIVIRPKEKAKGEFIKIFFESPVGLAIIKSFQRGTTIMNINYADIMEMEIPLLPMNRQQEIIDQYNEELKAYKEAIQKAEVRWSNSKDNIYNELL
ncbi:restriction endonuclease S subunit [Desulfitobacterium dichloroeliminans LMG P-21439]|uniref:Restriction endonuclease S subunit n=1 Tax=Desulfitobacterium dichloroeliminans (strain LMG P-21439 / DCA1) TaxID=871963 RepID=L0F472_DESDL|nr:restriction endonuclease S subunit [Desulfitobacterium dichloroeliminans LMG P-21439]